jgi:tryptophanyl-tRNA synthetase
MAILNTELADTRWAMQNIKGRTFTIVEIESGRALYADITDEHAFYYAQIDKTKTYEAYVLDEDNAKTVIATGLSLNTENLTNAFTLAIEQFDLTGS